MSIQLHNFGLSLGCQYAVCPVYVCALRSCCQCQSHCRQHGVSRSQTGRVPGSWRVAKAPHSDCLLRTLSCALACHLIREHMQPCCYSLYIAVVRGHDHKAQAIRTRFAGGRPVGPRWTPRFSKSYPPNSHRLYIHQQQPQLQLSIVHCIR